jgi:hypothetical protein
METLIGVISFSAISSVINTISTLSMNIYNITSNIKLNKNLYNEELNRILIRTDIETTIQLLESIISEIPEYMGKSTSVLLALHNVSNIISQIECELIKINKKINYNKNLYVLKNWRSLDFKDELNDLENLLNILEKRRDNLFKTIELFKTIPTDDLRKVDKSKLSSSVIMALDYKPSYIKLADISPIIEEIDESVCII